MSNSVCFLFIQGARVYPTLIGQRNYQVNETRRVRFSAQVLERLNLAVSIKDKLGGTIWKGRHLLPEWYENQRRLFSDQPPEILQEPIIVLRRATIPKKKLGMAVKDCKKYLATLPRKPEQSKTVCKKYLATFPRKPEQSNKYCKKYLATAPRKPEQSKKDCKKYLATLPRKPEQSNKYCKKYLATALRKPEQSNKNCKKYLVTLPCKPEQSKKDCKKYLATLPRKPEQSKKDCKKYLATAPCKPEQTNKDCKKYLATALRKPEQTNTECKKYLATALRKPEQSNKGLSSNQQPSNVRQVPQRRRISKADSSGGCPSEDKKLRSRRKVRNFSQSCPVNYTAKRSRT